MSQQAVAKRAAGEAAAALVESGMCVGLGTGSTTEYAIEAIGRRVREEGLEIVGTPTSYAAELLARKLRIPLAPLDELAELDLAIDGADEIDPELNLIKGRGAAHSREKVVASLARQFIVLGDESKLVDRLGRSMPVPVEVLPMAATPVRRALERMGAPVEIRMGVRKDGPVVTDQGFWILDAHFRDIEDPEALDAALLALPGVLDHGLFLGIATDVLVGELDGTVRHLRRRGG